MFIDSVSRWSLNTAHSFLLFTGFPLMTTFLHPLRCYTYQQRLTRKSEFLFTWSSEWPSGAVSRHLFKVCKHAEKKPQAQLHKHKEVKNGWKVHGLFCHHSRQLAVCQENAVSHDFTAYSMTSLAPVTVITWREKYLKSAVSWVLPKNYVCAFFIFLGLLNAPRKYPF